MPLGAPLLDDRCKWSCCYIITLSSLGLHISESGCTFVDSQPNRKAEEKWWKRICCLVEQLDCGARLCPRPCPCLCQSTDVSSAVKLLPTNSAGDGVRFNCSGRRFLSKEFDTGHRWEVVEVLTHTCQKMMGNGVPCSLISWGRQVETT